MLCAITFVIMIQGLFFSKKSTIWTLFLQTVKVHVGINSSFENYLSRTFRVELLICSLLDLGIRSKVLLTVQ